MSKCPHFEWKLILVLALNAGPNTHTHTPHTPPTHPPHTHPHPHPHTHTHTHTHTPHTPPHTHTTPHTKQQQQQQQLSVTNILQNLFSFSVSLKLNKEKSYERKSFDRKRNVSGVGDYLCLIFILLIPLRWVMFVFWRREQTRPTTNQRYNPMVTLFWRAVSMPNGGSLISPNNPNEATSESSCKMWFVHDPLSHITISPDAGKVYSAGKKSFDNFIMLVGVQGSLFHIAAGSPHAQKAWGSQDSLYKGQIQKLL